MVQVVFCTQCLTSWGRGWTSSFPGAQNIPRWWTRRGIKEKKKPPAKYSIGTICSLRLYVHTSLQCIYVVYGLAFGLAEACQFIVDLYNAPINVKPEGGGVGVGQPTGIWPWRISPGWGFWPDIMHLINLVPRTFTLAWGWGRVKVKVKVKVLGTRLAFDLSILKSRWEVNHLFLLILTIILCPGVVILIIFLIIFFRKCQNPHPMPDLPPPSSGLTLIGA